MPDLPAPALPSDAAGPEDFSRTLLEVAQTGFILFRPVYDATGATITDLAYEYLNPAAQQMLRLPPYPAESFLARFPQAEPAGIFAFYRDAFLSGETQREAFDFQHDGLDGYFHLVARRQGPRLVVSFLDTHDPLPVAQAQALHQSQAREAAARAQAEQQQQRLHQALMQLPANVALLQGPSHVLALVNPNYQQLFPGRALLGRAARQALPELAGQGFFDVLDRVYRTGEPFELAEAETWADFAGTGQPERRYYNASFLPLLEEGRITGILNVAFDVTAQVVARQQAARFNEELELRVTARSAETRAALFEVEQQRERLRVQQGLLRQILGQVPAAIATLSGPEHRFSFFNDHYQTLAAGRAVLGRTAAEVLPEVQEQGFLALLDQVYATGQPFAGTETAAMLHDETTGQAELHYLDLIYQPLFDGHQQPQGILVFILDVTDRVRARKQADTLQAAMLAVVQRQAQQRQDLFQVFEQTPVAIVLLREPDHRIDYFNPAFVELFPPEEWAGPLQGHTLAEVYPRIKLAGLVELMDKVFATGESQAVLDMPLDHLQPGSPRYVTFAYQAYREQGRIVGVAAFVYDVTEQVLARQKTEATARQLRLLTDALPVLIGYLDRDHIYRFANQAYQDWFGQDPAALLGRSVRDVVGEAAYQTALPRMARALAGERVDFDARMDYRPGFFRHIRTSYVPDVQAGQVLGFYTLVLDVTDQVLAREQVQALNEELAAINEKMQATNEELHDTNTRLTRTNADLDTFVYSASHDLKSPITNIEGLLLALREHLPPTALADPLVPRLLAMMDGAVARFQQTLGHLTDITRLQEVVLHQPAEALDLPALVEAVRLDILPELTAAGATLTVDLAGCSTLHFSPKNLRSIVYNLLSNAIKYRAPGRAPEVLLRCYRRAGQVLLSVQDNGLGLSKEQQGELFQMFRRLHSHVPGSGVGLYMVKKIVENAGGTIAVQSEPGVGSTFTVALPSAS